MAPVDQLLAEFDALVEEVERHSINPTWRLADWLVANVPNAQGARTDLGARAPVLVTADLAERSGLSERWLREMRHTAATFTPAERVEGGNSVGNRPSL